MEMKIIKLLNEFEKEKTKQDVRFWNYYQNGFHYLENGQAYSELLMVSKKYEFIKWLVENDKIDFSRDGKYCEKSIEEFDGLLRVDEDALIMILAISDTPIEDLILYLK